MGCGSSNVNSSQQQILLRDDGTLRLRVKEDNCGRVSVIFHLYDYSRHFRPIASASPIFFSNHAPLENGTLRKKLHVLRQNEMQRKNFLPTTSMHRCVAL